MLVNTHLMKFIIAFTASILLFSSCRRNNDLEQNSGEGYWILGGERHDITKTERNATTDFFILSGKQPASSSNILQLYFQKKPTAGAKLKWFLFMRWRHLIPMKLGLELCKMKKYIRVQELQTMKHGILLQMLM